MRSLIFLLAFMLLLPQAGPVEAHREKTILTTIELNPRSNMLEVIHQIYAHDVEHAFGNIVQSAGGLESIRARALVSLELSKSFRLWDADGEEIPLKLIGAELESEFFYFYQEAAVPAIPTPMRVEDGILRNYWEDMQNSLNVDYDGTISSLIFSGNDGSKLISRQ